MGKRAEMIAMIAAAIGAPVLAGETAAGFAADYRTPVVQAPYAEEKPVIDGKLDDALWQKCLYLNALRSKDRMMSYRGTAFWIAWDEDSIYVAMRSPLRPGEKPIRKFRDTERDINVVFDDAFEVFLGANSTSPDGQPVFFQYLGNFDGARYDAMHEPRVGNRREGWTANWEVKSAISPKNEWEMEMRIPRETVYREKFRENETITMLIARDFKRPWEQNSFEGTADFSVGESHTHVKLVRGKPVVRFLGAADAAKKTFGLDFEAASDKPVKLEWSFATSTGFEKKGTLDVPAGGRFVKPAGIGVGLVPEDTKGHCRVMVKNGKEVLLDWMTDTYFTPDFEAKSRAEFAKPDPGDVIDLSTVYNPVANVLRLSADFIMFDARGDVEKSEVRVCDASGKEVAKCEFPIDDRAYCRGTMRLPAIGGGDYKVTTDVIGKGGKKIRTIEGSFSRIDVAKKWPFLGTKAGNPEKVLAPWTPVEDSGATVSVWGRDMTVGAAGLPEQVTSQGKKLLARPATLTLVDDKGESFAAKLEGRPRKTFDKDWRKTYETVSKAGSLVVRSKTTVEYDGMYKVEMTLVPPKGGINAKSLKFVLPVAGDFAKYVYGAGAEIRSGFDMRWLPEKGDANGVVWDSRKVDSQPMLVGSFIPYVWLGAEKGGICFFADKDEGWVPNDDVPAIQFVRNGKDVDMAFNFISSDFEIAAPRTIVFALEASPVKPLVGDWRAEKWWCGYTFDFGWGSWVYPKGGGSTIWQSRPNTTNIAECKKRVDECHEPGRIAVPYFEYNTMTDVANEQVDFNGIQQYYGDAWKMDSGNILCYCDSLQDYIVWNLDHWIKSCGIDGWYLDNVRPCFSSDVDGGYGYRLPDGRVQPEFNMFAMRRFFLRLRAVFQENGKKPHIVNHMTNNMILPWNGPCDVAYDGEANVIFWGQKRDGTHQTDFMDVWSLERLFTATPSIWGINVNFMHEYQGNWQQFCKWDEVRACYRAYEGAVMLHDAMPTGNHGADPWTHDFMKCGQEFGFGANDRIEFLPYWRAAEGGLSFDEKKKIYCSAWLDRAAHKTLVIVTNWGDAQKAKVSLDFGKLGVDPKAEVFASFNVAGMKPTDVIPMKGGAFEVDVVRHSYVLVTVEKREKAK